MSLHQRRTRHPYSSALVICLAFTTPVMAQAFRDDATGLAITPPAGYTTQPGPDHARYGLTVNVKKADDKDTGCRIGFQPAPQNATLTQNEINAMAATPEREGVIRNTLSTIYDVKTLTTFEHDGVRGVVILGEFKMTPGVPPRAGELQNVLYMLETPKGRTNIICVVEKTSYEGRRAEFETLARGVKVPR